jgi:hypothetical protein
MMAMTSRPLGSDRPSYRRGKFFALSAFAIACFSPYAALADHDVMRVEPVWEASFVNHSGIVAAARRDIGKTGPQIGLPARNWCGLAIERWRRAAGLRLASSGLALDQARAGKRIARPVVGALLITRRKGGGHVEVISSVHADGTVTTISGNVSRRVVERRRATHGLIVLPF